MNAEGNRNRRRDTKRDKKRYGVRGSGKFVFLVAARIRQTRKSGGDRKVVPEPSLLKDVLVEAYLGQGTS